MNELLQAAKAVIEATDTGDRWCAIANLSAAVERAEKQEAAVQIWYRKHWEAMEHKSRAWLSWEVWQAAQQAERERIKAVIRQFSAECSEDGEWVMCCDELLENIEGGPRTMTYAHLCCEGDDSHIPAEKQDAESC